MLQKEIVERVQMLPFAGIISDDNRLDILYVISLINSTAAQIKKEIYQKNNKRLNPVCYQKYWPKYEADLQDTTDCVKFRCPEVISMDSNSDGFRYIGNIECSQEFSRIRNRSMLSTINKHQVMSSSNGLFTSVLYDGSAQVLEVYGNKEIEEVLVEAVFADPRSIPTWNPDKDPYPFPDDLLPMLEDYIFRSITSIEASTPVPNRVDESTQSTTQRRRR